MGWFLNEGGEGHEGHLARILEDGTRTGTFGGDVPELCVGVEVQCECGWVGSKWMAPGGTWQGFDGINAHEDDAENEWAKHAEGREALASLKAAGTNARRAEEELRAAVDGAVEHGASWSEVGDALGVSKQAAWERFNRN